MAGLFGLEERALKGGPIGASEPELAGLMGHSKGLKEAQWISRVFHLGSRGDFLLPHWLAGSPALVSQLRGDASWLRDNQRKKMDLGEGPLIQQEDYEESLK